MPVRGRAAGRHGIYFLEWCDGDSLDAVAGAHRGKRLSEVGRKRRQPNARVGVIDPAKQDAAGRPILASAAGVFG